MRVALLTREYPPEVYGGAGVHVEYLARELRRFIDVEVHCFGKPRSEPGVFAHFADPTLLELGANAALLTMSTDLSIAAQPATPTSCTRTPGTRTSPATSRSCSKMRRT